MDTKTYEGKSKSLVALKRKVQTTFDIKNKITTVEEATQAKELIQTFLRHSEELKASGLTKTQMTKHEELLSPKFNGQLQEWMAQMDHIIPKPELPTDLKHQRKTVLDGLLEDLQQATTLVLQSNDETMDELLTLYKAKQIEYLHKLKEKGKFPNDSLKQLFSSVNKHVAEIKQQRNAALVATTAHTASEPLQEPVEQRVEQELPATHEQPVVQVHHMHTHQIGAPINVTSRIGAMRQDPTPTHETPRSKVTEAVAGDVSILIGDLLVKFESKYKQLRDNKKFIHYGTNEEDYQLLLACVDDLQDKVFNAYERFQTHCDLDILQQDITSAFSDQETVEIFAKNRTNSWLRPITLLFEQLKEALNKLFFPESNEHVSVVAAPTRNQTTSTLGTFFKPLLDTRTETTKMAEEYEEEIEKAINRHRPIHGG